MTWPPLAGGGLWQPSKAQVLQQVRHLRVRKGLVFQPRSGDMLLQQPLADVQHPPPAGYISVRKDPQALLQCGLHQMQTDRVWLLVKDPFRNQSPALLVVIRDDGNGLVKGSCNRVRDGEQISRPTGRNESQIHARGTEFFNDGLQEPDIELTFNDHCSPANPGCLRRGRLVLAADGIPRQIRVAQLGRMVQLFGPAVR